MGKQSIRKCVWTIGGRRRRKETGGLFPIGVLAGPILGGITSNLVGPLLKKNNWRWKNKNAIMMTEIAISILKNGQRQYFVA